MGVVATLPELSEWTLIEIVSVGRKLWLIAFQEGSATVVTIRGDRGDYCLQLNRMGDMCKQMNVEGICDDVEMGW